jgi:NADH-quinone oxidoreductase subunit M
MLALLGSYNPAPALDPVLFRVLMVGGGVGTVLTAGYLLWTIQRVNLGRVPEKFADGHGIHDVSTLEWIAWAPLLVLILAVGLVPGLLLDLTNGSVKEIMHLFGTVAGH